MLTCKAEHEGFRQKSEKTGKVESGSNVQSDNSYEKVRNRVKGYGMRELREPRSNRANGKVQTTGDRLLHWTEVKLSTK